MTEAIEVEKSPLKKRATRKKVVQQTHAQRERLALFEKFVVALNKRPFNNEQIKALSKKIMKREATIKLQEGK